MALEQVTVEYNLALEKAKAQFNGLVQTIQQGEQKITNSSKQANNQILSDEQKAHNKRVQFIKEETQDLAELQKRKKLAYSPEEISQYNKRIAESQQRIRVLNGETGNLTKTNGNLIGSLRSIAGAVGIAFSVQQLISFGKEMVDLNHKANGVSKAFNNIASSQDLAALRAATGFGVSDLQLQQLAVRASTFKISLETLPTLLKFATIRAAETGQEVDYLVNSIIDGIGRQSPLILDNLGISAKDLQVEFKRTGDFAQAVGAIIERDMGKSVLSINDAVSQTDKLATSWENLKVVIANGVAPVINSALSGINEVLKSQADYDNVNATTNLNEITLALNAFGKEVVSVKTGFLTIDEVIEKNTQLFKEQTYVLPEVADVILKLRDALDKTSEQYKSLRDEAGKLDNYDAFETKIAEILLLMLPFEKQGLTASKAYISLATSLEIVRDAMRDFTKELNQDVPVVTQSIEYLTQRIGELREEQEKLDTTHEGSIKRYAQLQQQINSYQRKIDELRRLGDPLGSFNIERIGDEIEVSKKQLKDLESIMEGIADKTLTASQMLKKFDDEIKNLKKSTGDANIGGFLTEDTIKKQEEFNSILTSSVTTLVGDLTGLFNAIGQQQDDAINRQLEGERTRAQEHFDIMKGIWQQQLENGQITKEELFNQETAYTEKINALEAKQAEIRKQQLRKQAIAEKANASFQLIIGTATSVAKNLANPPAIIAILALAAAQLGIIAATPIPEFAKGVVGLQGAGTETSDSIHAKLSKGESVITAKATRANKDALTAMNNGEYEKFVQQKYIMPALEVKREKQRNSFAESISRSMQSGTYDDSLLIHETRKNKQVSIRNADQIGKATARELGRNSYFKNRV